MNPSTLQSDPLSSAASAGNAGEIAFKEDIQVFDIGAEADNSFVEDDGPSDNSLGAIYRRLNERVEALSTIKTSDKVSFFQLLAIMVGAGVPLVRALYVLSDQLRNARLRIAVRSMASKVESGKTLSEAMEDFSGIFKDAQIGMVRAGEASGRMNEILTQVATQAEKTAAVGSKIKGAMIYPAAVITIMIGAILVILGMVIPQLMGLFTQSGAELPASTQLLMTMSDLVVAQWKTILATLFVAGGLFYLWKRTENGRYHWDGIVLKIPIFGTLSKHVALARFTRTLSSLMNSGIPIVKSLQIDADAVGNEVYRRRLFLAAEDVSRGIPLAENLTDSNKIFPEMVVSMIAIGEQTAELAAVSDKIADYYDASVDQMASNMTKLLEPIIVVTMGLVVGGLIVAVMQPIFSLLDVVGNI
jgi:type IV pilus assembly protein PilC